MRSLSTLRSLLLAGVVMALASLSLAQAPDPVPDLELVPSREMPKTPKESEIPVGLRWLLHPLKRGMMLNLPVVDTDPNRGVTYGVMPIWVIREKDGERIEQIHAPSLVYNHDFGLAPTYRYYYYPQTDAALVVRGAVAKFEHEVLVQYDDSSFKDTEIDLSLRAQWNRDAGQRYFGRGPNSSKNNETNYTEDYIQYLASVGAPFRPQSHWRAHLSDWFTADKISDGPLRGLPAFSATFPKSSQAASGREGIHVLRLVVDYDTRDQALTTSRGAYLQTFAGYSVRNLGSEEDFSRYGFDARYFFPWNEEHKTVTAAQVRFEQVMGNSPFWLQSRLGGKYALRAYGDGRYTDRGLLVGNVEQRFTFYKAKMADVWTEFELAPFAGLGTVFNNPERMAGRYARPVVGTAVRAVARPQVVGSIDFGYGQEGLAVFMDINYSF
ncbi:MAG: BamA/TamA family outer membrane protein [Elusimicrobia bacterium]|nr:BamA/TamA family outer membrane protein [Elusimicrobiota bacterium]